jgi:hypothetical protein
MQHRGGAASRLAARLVGTTLAALASALCLAGSASAAQTPDLPLIGRSAVVTNDVEGQLPTAPDRKKVVVNEDVFLDETMYTVSDSSMVVEFRDGSTLELGPDAVFTIDKLVFNPEKSTTEKAVNILQGTFRYVSGFAVDKQTVDIKTPSGTLGIRGSVVIGLVDVKAPTFIYVAQGIASFANDAGRQELVSGRAIIVTGPNSPPSSPSIIPPQVIAQTLAAILKHLPPVALTNNRPSMSPAQALRFAQANALALALQLEQQKKTADAVAALKEKILAQILAQQLELQKSAQAQEAAKAKALTLALAQQVEQLLKSAGSQDAAKTKALVDALAAQLEQQLKSVEAQDAEKTKALVDALAAQLEQQLKSVAAADAAKVRAAVLALEQQLERQKQSVATLEKELPLLIQGEKLGIFKSQQGLTAEQQQFLRDAELVVPNAQALLNRIKDEQQKYNVANAQLGVTTVLADMARAGVPPNVLAAAVAAAMHRDPQFDLAIARALAAAASPQTLRVILATFMDTAPRLSKQLADAMTSTLKARHDISPALLADLTLAIDKSAGETKRTGLGAGGKTGPGVGGISKEQALAAILSGTDKGLQLLQKYFDESGSPKAVVALTQELIAEIRQDPAFKDLAKLQAVADQIAKVAADSINSAHVLKVAVDPAMTLSGNQRGFEFGPPDMKKFANFESVPPKDPRIAGKDVRGLRRPETAPLLGSGISGVQTVQLSLPNGEYRIILVTGNTGIPGLEKAPLGDDVAVNGQSYHVAGGGSPDTWQGLITLGNSGVNALGGDTGGAIVLTGKVTDGVLQVDLNGAPGSTFLAAMIVEPFGEPSIIIEDPSADTWFDPGDESRTEALAEIDDAIGNLLSDITTAAGPDQLAQNLGLQTPLPTDNSTLPVSGN